MVCFTVLQANFSRSMILGGWENYRRKLLWSPETFVSLENKRKRYVFPKLDNLDFFLVFETRET